MATEILINVHTNQTRVAYVEDKTLVDLKIDRKASPTLVGSIYKGKVLRVLPGMQAAFVDIGLSKAAFLYVGDIRYSAFQRGESIYDVEDIEATTEVLESKPREPTDQNRPPIQELIKPGQFLLVQVAKDPLGTKGSRITTHISLPGRNIVYMPTVLHFGVSRRIADEVERDRLKSIIEKINPVGGVIVRTAGEGATKEDILADIEYSSRLWSEILLSYEKKNAIGLVHSEVDVELRALRDLLNENVDRVIIDDPIVYKKVLIFVAQSLPKFKNRVVLHKEDKPLFDLYDLDLEISRALGHRIWLKSGGYIVIDEAEALVVVDVNTGKYVGKRDLDDTIVTTNIEAAREIAHQLRIRNCGGIIIIDFIDMEKESHRDKVMVVFKEELAKDRARTVVSTISEFGLVEMTRKRIRPSLIASLCDPCPYCEGRGYIKQKSTIAHEIFRSLERESARHRDKATTVVRCQSVVADWIYAEEAEALEKIEQALGHSVAFKIEPDFHIEQFEVENL
ncbi:MAG: ribonuclease G [Bdellovibrionales bacterium RBG_16_40_8]|nr:MAG: ribonuclease G [Bdellovibrionales bacterium RBG_16_40_8]